MSDTSGSAPLEQAVSAGGIVYRSAPSGIELVLCGRRDSGLWALPKGTPEPGEPLERTAAREVEEETGLRVVLEERVGSTRYTFSAPDGTKYDKQVELHLMRPVGGDLDRHDGEYDVVEWFPLEEALTLLTYPNDREIVRQAARILVERERA